MSKFLKWSVLFLRKSNKDKKENNEKMEGPARQLNNPPNEEQQMLKTNEEQQMLKTNEEQQMLKTEELGKLFVGGLSYSTTAKDLEDYFSRFGKIADLIISRSPATGKSQGFGFVTFVDPKDAAAALQVEVHVLGGKKIDIRQFSSNPPCENIKNRVFLGGLPHNITEEELRQFFSKYGEIVEVVIPRDKNTRKPKGFGFLSFKTEQAAEKCKADVFVSLKGKRIQIKKAEVRNSHCEGRDSLSSMHSKRNIGKDSETSGLEGNEDILSVSSGTECLADHAFEPFTRNYFFEKLATDNEMDEKTLKDESEARPLQNTEVTEVEKLLADFQTFFNNNPKDSDPNLIDFSDKETESEDENESGDDIADFLPSDAFTGDVETSEKLKPSAFSKENSPSKAFDDVDFSVFEKLMPLKIKNKEGFLKCALCQWIAPNNSAEIFLAHCRTSLHKGKLKDRFLSEQSSEQPQKVDSKPKTLPEKPSPVKAKKKWNKVRNTQEDQKEEQQPATATTSEVDKQNIYPTNKTRGSIKEAQKINSKKIRALAKGVTSIQSFSEDEFICTVCNKTIPKALEFHNVMKNITSHLQSKKHLKILSEPENLLKSSLETECKKKERQIQNNPTAQGKKVEKDSEPTNYKKSKASFSKKPQNVPKVINPAGANNLQTGNPVKKKQESAADSNVFVRFLCLPCNVMCENTEVFNVHLGLKSHVRSLESSNIKADVFLTNMGKCKSCQNYLFGSLLHINKHYSKCLKK